MRKSTIITHATFGLLVFGIAACGAGAPDREPVVSDSTSSFERVQQIDQDLGIGSTGQDVKALHDYLTRYGYFPNQELARDYPAWRPLVADAPANESVFDEHTVDAVRRLQVLSGIRETGIVDERTRAILKKYRCGTPDGIARIDPTSKFALRSTTPFSPGQFVGWRFTEGGNPSVTTGAKHDRIREAFQRWAEVTSLTFFEVTQCQETRIGCVFTQNIVIETMNLDSGTLGSTVGGNSPAAVTMGNLDWGLADRFSSPTPGKPDFLAVVTHEIGHALGLAHSSVALATMQGTFGNADRPGINVDDKVAISTVSDSWDMLPGLGRDIAANAFSVWLIGRDGNKNSPIFKWHEATRNWDQELSGGAASRIAVTWPNGLPWVLAELPNLCCGFGAVFRRTTNDPATGVWQELPGVLARDIGAGGDGSVWITRAGTEANTEILKWVGDNPLNALATGNFVVEAGGGRASQIAVSKSGIPWVAVDGSGGSPGSIWRRTSSDVSSGGWQLLSGIANDIGVAQENVDEAGRVVPYAWVIGTTSVGNGDFSIHVWDEQSTFNDGSSPLPPAAGGWIRVPGGAQRITVGSHGDPWVVNNAGNIFRPLR
jgi:hypothetical protein